MKMCDERVPNRIRKAYEDQSLGIKRDKSSLFASMLDSSLPKSEKALPRLAAEGVSMLAAGTETTAVSPSRKHSEIPTTDESWTIVGTKSDNLSSS